ncbi:probable galacturonosyltransferase 15 [Cornus florida]|uniref:probable galacturonosyltransferase 15 n=1 Tax=Cornus florida TaxID=4283 RepID=UPI00289FA02F|nr:probable galacturonosyltransferase 15 [Cornus florida]
MKYYISTTGIKKVTISNAIGGGVGGVMKGKGSPPTRRLSHRLVLPASLMLGILLPFLFLRIAFIVLESATVDCMGWRLFGGSETSLKLREELTKALVEANTDLDMDMDVDGAGIGIGFEERSPPLPLPLPLPASFKDLVTDVTSKKQDIKAFAFNTKAMILNMERKIHSARQRESFFWHLASNGVPKSLYCLCLKLAEEYAINAMARSRLPPPEFVSRLTDPSLHHVVLLTDNVLAASVVISSTIKSSANPEKLVFHIITDKKTYTPMHAWFAVNSINSAVVEVRGLHQYDWSHEVNAGVREMLEIHRLIWSHNYHDLKEDIENEGGHGKNLEFLSPSSISLMNHLRIYIPELFPDLNKIVFLDDDIVVQHDLSSLWELDLNGKVVGAVVDSWCGHNCCPGRKYKDYFNFTNPIISSNLDHDSCGWLYGMNVFDLQAWRETNITATYHQWLKLSLDSGLTLWRPGALPPALIAFEGYVHPIDPSWHFSGLGYRFAQVDPQILEVAAVVHFSGPAKPWLEIGFPKVRRLWNRHVNFSNDFIRKCRIRG